MKAPHPSVAVIDYGAGNLFSVTHALEAAGARVSIAQTSQDLARASRVVLPGVGAFGAGIAALRAGDLDQAIAEFTASGRPFLGICLGMHLLLEHSDELGDHRGLGLFSGRVRRLPSSVTVPHIGWNQFSRVGTSRILQEDFAAYFAHSYHVDGSHPYCVATVDHGGPVAAALERDNVFALQFHPEKSGDAGQRPLRRFLEI